MKLALSFAAALLAGATVASAQSLPTTPYGLQAPTALTQNQDTSGLDKPQATVSKNGKFTVTGNIAITTPTSTSTPITCTVMIQHSNGLLASYSDTYTVNATRSGGTAKCVVAVPVLWPQADNTAPVIVSLSVVAGKRQHTRTWFLNALPATDYAVTHQVRL